MSEFFNVLPPDEARELLVENTTIRTSPEVVSTYQALRRVTSSAIYAPHDLPSFNRSTMDGYAVRAADTFGASETLPAVLSVIGEVAMGREAEITLGAGESVEIHTGGMIPEKANAVVQVEHTQVVGTGDMGQGVFEIEVYKPVSVGQNLLIAGEDVQESSEVLAAGHVLRAQDIGGLLALGVTEVRVVKKPEVAIMATGDEIVDPSNSLEPGQVRDINSYTIGSLVEQSGGSADLLGVVADDFDSLYEAASLAVRDHDMLVITAGSSVSVRDMTVKVIDRLGKPGVLLHGVATRPGKPTVLGAVDGKPILGLPGNPVSAMVQFMLLGVPVVYRLQGVLNIPRRGLVWARISRNVASESGREDFIPARLRESNEGFTADPVFGKSNLIYTLVNADGLLRVPINKAGLEAGEWVEVHLF
jgi:molybdopterin molybdotransferase